MYKGKMNYSSKGDAGCVKQASEQKVAMTQVGGKKYSYNNPAEMKKKSDALARQM